MDGVNNIKPYTNVDYTTGRNVEDETAEQQVCDEKTYELPKEAVDAMKASALYEPSSRFKEYIPIDASPVEVRNILADKSKVDRSFFGYKRAIKNEIKNSKNPQQAIANLNFLMNAENRSLPASEISEILTITESVNSGSLGESKYFRRRFGFDGGKLNNKSLKSINDQRLMSILISESLGNMNSYPTMINIQNQYIANQNKQ